MEIEINWKTKVLPQKIKSLVIGIIDKHKMLLELRYKGSETNE